MPRIAASGIVLALVAAAIGLNMARYPAVWQMAVPPSRSPPSEEPAPSADPAHPAILAPVGGPERDTAPPPIADQPPRATTALPIGRPGSEPPAVAAGPQPAGDAGDLHAEPLAEYRRQRDANGLAAAAGGPPSAVAVSVAASPSAALPSAPSPPATSPPTAPQPPAEMSKEWPSEAAAALRVVASPAPPQTPAAAMMPVEKRGDSPVFAETKTGTVPETQAGTVPETRTGMVPVVKTGAVAAAAPVENNDPLPPVVRPVSVSSGPAAGGDDAIRPLPPVDSTTPPPPEPLPPGVPPPVYPSTGMK